jgi:hypothetical protein
MADFADQVSDERAGRRLARAIQGKGAFRRFKAGLQEEGQHPHPGQPARLHAEGRKRDLGARSAPASGTGA